MLTDEEKREALGKALLALVGIAKDAPLILHGYFHELVVALAEEAIVAKVNIEHRLRCNGEPYTDIYGILDVDQTYASTMGATISGHLGKPGKATAIIIPEEDKCKE